jgi:hypothetical protein
MVSSWNDMKGENSPMNGARVDVYNDTAYGSSLVLTKYTDSNGMANFGLTNIESGEVAVSKEGYLDQKYLLTTYSMRNVTLTLRERPALKVYVDESSSDYNYPVVYNAKVELYNKSGGTYTLIKTAYTDSSGVANFGNISIDNGMIEVSKEGYYNSTGLIEYSGLLTTFTVRLVKAVANASSDYPLIQAGGSGCISPNRDEAPPQWVIGAPDGKEACFWETEPIFGTFGRKITISKLNLTVAANTVSVNKPLDVLTSNSTDCYYEALSYNFSSYSHYVTFIPDVADSLKGYAVSNGTVSAICIAVNDTTHDGYGYYIDSIRVYP